MTNEAFSPRIRSGIPGRSAPPERPRRGMRRLHSLRIRPLRLAATVLLIAANAAAATAAESLWLLRCTDPVVLARVAARGAVVSRVEGDAAFVFADGLDAAALVDGGCAPLQLDADSAGSEYYLLFAADARRLDDLQPPVRLLHRAGGLAVVACPSGEAERLAALGQGIAKLFRTPMRLAPRVAVRAALPDLVGAAPPIDSLVTRVAVESVDATVATLQGFGTRRATKHGGEQAAEWIAAKFRSYGIGQVAVEPWTAGMAGNVIATIPGRTSPRDVYIVGGHYDSYVPDSDFEPGADDNASGTAAVLECARVCAAYPFANTVRFIAFGGEELGLLGSEAYASALGSSDEWIVGMINLDMIGYLGPTSDRDLDVVSNIPSLWMLDAATSAARRFVPGFPVIRSKLTSGSSDHASFWRHYYCAIMFHEDGRESSPYLHTVNDVIGTSYNDPQLALLTTRVLVATIASLAGGPQVPVALESFVAEAAVGGVLLQWRVPPAVRAAVAGIDVERAAAAPGPFQLLNDVPLAADRESYLDATAPVDRTSFYRLALRGANGGAALGPVLAVTPAGDDAPSRLLPVTWSAGGDAAVVRYRVGRRAGDVRLAIHDVRGRVLRTLHAGREGPGEHLTMWDGTTSAGGRAARGVYLIVLQAQDAQQARRLVWLHP